MPNATFTLFDYKTYYSWQSAMPQANHLLDIFILSKILNRTNTFVFETKIQSSAIKLISTYCVDLTISLNPSVQFFHDNFTNSCISDLMSILYLFSLQRPGIGAFELRLNKSTASMF